MDARCDTITKHVEPNLKIDNFKTYNSTPDFPIFKSFGSTLFRRKRNVSCFGKCTELQLTDRCVVSRRYIMI